MQKVRLLVLPKLADKNKEISFEQLQKECLKYAVNVFLLPEKLYLKRCRHVMLCKKKKNCTKWHEEIENEAGKALQKKRV